MKKTGDYTSWILMAVLIQTIFLIFLRAGIKPIYLLNYTSFAGFFLLYRYLLDWTLWNNPMQKFLKKLVIRKDALHQGIFAFFATIFLVFANKSLFVFEFQFLFFAFTSIIVGSTLVEVIRQLNLPKAKTKIHAYNFNKIKEGKNAKKKYVRLFY